MSSPDLSAIFAIEHRFDPDTGVLDDPNVFWRDKSGVGLASKQHGEARLASLHGPGTAGRYEAFFGDLDAHTDSREGLQRNCCKFDGAPRKGTNDHCTDADSTRLTTGYCHPLPRRPGRHASLTAHENQVSHKAGGALNTDRISCGHELSLRHQF
ncbi:MAG TPA: hypothetical protein VFL86_16360 [Burkholderiaceae bacterium]|nr:hypothetical protein [Burkholderiaceae bacterium]